MNDVRPIDRIHPDAYPVDREIKKALPASAINTDMQGTKERRQSRERRRKDKKQVLFERRLNRRRSRRIDVMA